MLTVHPIVSSATQVVDAVIAALARGCAGNPLAEALSVAWNGTHEVFHLRARMSWIHLVEAELGGDAPWAVQVHRAILAIVHDQRHRMGLSSAWRDAGGSRWFSETAVHWVQAVMAVTSLDLAVEQ